MGALCVFGGKVGRGGAGGNSRAAWLTVELNPLSPNTLPLCPHPSSAAGKHNVAFAALLLLGRVGECADLLVAANR